MICLEIGDVTKKNVFANIISQKSKISTDYSVGYCRLVVLPIMLHDRYVDVATVFPFVFVSICLWGSTTPQTHQYKYTFMSSNNVFYAKDQTHKILCTDVDVTEFSRV